VSLADITALGFFSDSGTDVTLYDITTIGIFDVGVSATSTGMIIDNHHIATIGWFMNDSELKVPDGEEIFTGGWLDGTITSTAAGEAKYRKGIRWWLLIPKRFRFHR